MQRYKKAVKFGLSSVTVIGLVAVTAPAANALSFTYEQNFSNGVLTGSFSGSDDDLNGVLSIGGGRSMEFDSFEMKYVGGGREILWVLEDLDLIGNATDFDIAERELNIVVQNVQSSDDFIFCANNFAFCGSNIAEIWNIRTDEVIDFTKENATVALVPSPTAVLPTLIGMGLSTIRKSQEKDT